MTLVRADKDFTFDERFAKAFADSIRDWISFAQEDTFETKRYEDDAIQTKMRNSSKRQQQSLRHCGYE
jgi:hypothetical protein